MRISNVLVASAYGPMIVNFRDRYIGARFVEDGYAAKGEAENLIKLCEALLSQGAPIVVFDLGANVGTHSLALAKTFDGRIAVHVVEAQHQVFHMLCSTMALNGLDMVRCYRAAISDRAGETLTYDLPVDRQANNLGGLELVPPALSDNADLVKAGREAAPTITIESFAVKVYLIKLDVEGMKLRALQGGQHTIARDKPIIFMDFQRSDRRALAMFLTKNGYLGFAHSEEILAIPPERRITIKGLKKAF